MAKNNIEELISPANFLLALRPGGWAGNGKGCVGGRGQNVRKSLTKQLGPLETLIFMLVTNRTR
jgi:hypothetical protein